VISVGKLVQENDGPEEVEQILSTITKYGAKLAGGGGLKMTRYNDISTPKTAPPLSFQA
jgi:hypothetical protein